MGFTTKVKELNKKNVYTKEQLLKLKKFEGKYLDVYLRHYDYKVDGVGYVTVYEVRGISDEVRENFRTVEEIVYR